MTSLTAARAAAWSTIFLPVTQAAMSAATARLLTVRGLPRAGFVDLGDGVVGEQVVIGPGQDQGPGLAVRPGALSGGAAPGDHQRADRLDGTVTALGRAAGTAGLRGPGGADRVEGAGLALPAAVLPVRAARPGDPDACCGDVAGQPGAVTAGPFDPGQAHGPESAQPAQQAGVARPR